MIVLVDVSITLGDFSLNKINIEVRSGEFFTILGPTGAGKTVILELIAGLYMPETGKVMINGSDAINIPPDKREIGFVYQDYALFPHLNVYKNITFGLKLRKISSLIVQEDVKILADMLNIGHLLERFPGTLSGGEQQRVSLARALIMKPKILLMDEPFSAVDPNTRRMLCKLLKEVHKKYQCTVVHVTHDFNEASSLADRIGVILDGEVKQIGTPDKIFGRPQNHDVVKFLEMASLNRFNLPSSPLQKNNRENLKHGSEFVIPVHQ